MLCLKSKNKDPYYNLAAEEYLLKNTIEDMFILWQSDPVVVVGKHQNALAEINYRFIRNKGIGVARRLTGGGAVYHDRGNLNFSFIRQGEPGRLVDFGSYIEPVIRFLKIMGIEASLGKQHEILVNGKKISGNAEHVYKNRVLHHGTLLYDADLSMLRESIRPGENKYTDKAVKSNRSSVINLAECINPVLSLEDFQEVLFESLINRKHDSIFETDEYQESAIRQLAIEKYSSWEWIYGWSPDYEFNNHWRSGKWDMAIHLATHRGMITQCDLKSQELITENVVEISEKLKGTGHHENNIRKILEASAFSKILNNNELDDLVFSFF